MTRDEVITRRLIASILGILGVVILLDVLVIAVLEPGSDYSGFRQVLFVIIGGLLVVSGAVTFAWPKKGSIETKKDDE